MFHIIKQIYSFIRKQQCYHYHAGSEVKLIQDHSSRDPNILTAICIHCYALTNSLSHSWHSDNNNLVFEEGVVQFNWASQVQIRKRANYNI